MAATITYRPILFFSLLLFCALCGCAGYRPGSLNEVPFLERAQEKTEKRVTVRAAVPDALETRQVFGVDLYGRGIQPVWIEIDNNAAEPVWFLPAGVDPMYFSPLEASFKSHFPFSSDSNRRMDRFFFEKGNDVYIPPDGKRKGFVFTNLDEGTKDFVVDIVGEDKQARTFSFFIAVPGIQVDHHRIDFRKIYPEDEWTTIDDRTALSDYLKELPCCTSNKDGTQPGDPLNLAVIGSGDDIYHAFIRAGWDETETITSKSLWKTVSSFLFGRGYRYSPVSAQYLFGRSQDIALQKARSTIHKRNHLRLWLAPVLFKGNLVMVGQISRDIGVRFTTKTIVTHKIDPDVDETRSYLIQNLWYSQGLSKFTLVGGVGAAPFESPRHNLTGDPYFTDGRRAVLWVSSEPVAFDKVKFIEATSKRPPELK